MPFVEQKKTSAANWNQKLASPMLGGGTVFAIDHRIPNGVSIENYRYYIRTAREMLGLEPSHPVPFVRMAF